MKTKISKDKINFLDNGADPLGRVFEHDNRVFRAIYPEKQSYYFSMVQSGLLKELIDKNLIPNTWESEYAVEGFDLVLEHEKIRYNIPLLWSFSMLKAVAVNILIVNKIANKYGYQLIDAHPFNSCFDGVLPKFIDIGSFVPYSQETLYNWSYEYKRCIIAPLLMWNVRDSFFARKIIEGSANLYQRTIPTCFIENSQSYLSALEIFNAYHKKHSSESFLQLIKKVLQENIFEAEDIEQLFHCPASPSAWDEYQNFSYENLVKNENTQQLYRFKRILEIVKDNCVNVGSALDLAGNCGLFSYLLSKNLKCKHITSTDYEEATIEIAYKKFKDLAPNCSTFLLNFMYPYSKQVFQDLKSDIAFALAVTHHLLLSQNFKINQIFEMISRYSSKYVCIEFMPLGLWGGIGNPVPEVPLYYTEEWFEKSFSSYFSIIYKEKIEENRIVFLGEIK